MDAARRGESGYRILAREIRGQILRGRYADGRRLPTEAELSAAHGVSLQTVRRAFQDLVAEGMVYRVPGRGRSSPRPAERLPAPVRIDRRPDGAVGGHPHGDRRAAEPPDRRGRRCFYGRPPGDAVHGVAFRRLHDGVPFCVTSVALPPPSAGRWPPSPNSRRRGDQ